MPNVKTGKKRICGEAETSREGSERMKEVKM
jgi:hypothetical protein